VAWNLSLKKISVVLQTILYNYKKAICVYIFSDGYADQFGGEKGKKFMVANLQRTFAEITDKPMQEQYDIFICICKLAWQLRAIDDVLVIGVRV